MPIPLSPGYWTQLCLHADQNNLKHIAFFFTFFKAWRCNKSSVVTPKKISYGNPRKWISNFTKLHLTQEIFRILPVFSQFLWNSTFRFLGPMRNFLWCYYRWQITSLALEKCEKEGNIVWIILLQGFCPLKIKIT